MEERDYSTPSERKVLRAKRHKDAADAQFAAAELLKAEAEKEAKLRASVAKKVTSKTPKKSTFGKTFSRKKGKS